MKTTTYLIITAVICCFRIAGIHAGNSGFAHNNHFSKAEKLKTSFNNANISMNSFAFTENKGQVWGYDGLAHSEVKFVFQQANTQIFLLEKGIAYQFTRTHFPEGYSELMWKREGVQDMEKLQLLQEQIRTETFRMDMILVGANAHAQISSEGKSADYINYYNHDVMDVHQYNKITYHEIYPGIDWVIYAKDGQVKYDFVVKPGADPSLIKMQFKYQEDLSLNKNGGFTLKNSLGTITEEEPVSYQGKENIQTNFILKDNIISFATTSYDHSQNLVIDPALVWATYYGDSSWESGFSCATDVSGNVYMAGCTLSTSGIAIGGFQNTHAGAGVYYDAFLVKFNSSGVRLWATYYGGTNDDIARSCATDASGNIYIAGTTWSSAGLASGGHQNIFGGGFNDAFLVKFNSTGARLWATYYGGIGADGGVSCVTDFSGNIYLAGFTWTSAGLASGGHQNTFGGGSSDAFLVKFSSTGVRLWATYYGGSGDDGGDACATDASGNIYLAGYTGSSSGIASLGHQNVISLAFDAFLVKFDGSGVRLWATYYGGTGSDRGIACATDPLGNVYMSGETSSSISMASGGHQNTYGGGAWDAFLVKFNGNGLRQWATYYGGINIDIGLSCTVGVSGNVYLTGYSYSSSGIAFGGYQNTLAGPADVFLVEFNATGLRLWATYYGGPNPPLANSGDGPGGCCTDASGNIYVAGGTDATSGIASGGYQNTTGGVVDAFLVKFCGGISPSQPSIYGSNFFCAGVIQTYFSVNNDPNASSYTWILPVTWTGSSTTNTISVVLAASGTISVAATGTCGATAFQTLAVTVNPLPTITVNSGSICAGSVFTITPAGACTYTFANGSTTVSPAGNSSYSITGTSCAGCISSNTAVSNVTVLALPILIASASASTICIGETSQLTVSGANTYTWNTNENTANIFVTPTITTTYTVMATDSVGCNNTVTHTQIVDQCASLKDAELRINFIEVFPNPNAGSFEIRSANSVSISLYNELGQRVWENDTALPNRSVSVQGLASGIYLAHLVSQSGSSVRKIIIVSD